MAAGAAHGPGSTEAAHGPGSTDDLSMAKAAAGGECSSAARQRQEWDMLDPCTRRYAHLDLMRVWCVVLVVIDHGWHEYSAENVLYSQSWVLQLLWVVSGISSALGSMGLCRHMMRLGFYFVAGVAINWLGFRIAQRDWQAEFHNVIFHMFFIAGLILFVLFTACTKTALRRHRPLTASSGDGSKAATEEHIADCDAALEDGLPRAAAGPKIDADGSGGDPSQVNESCAGSGVATPPGRALTGDVRSLLIFVGVLFPYVVAQLFLAVWLKNEDPAILQSTLTSIVPIEHPFWTTGLDDAMILGQVTSALGTLLVAHTGAHAFRSTRLSPWLAWVVFLYQFVCRTVLVPCLFGQTRMGRIFSGFELFVLGLTAAARGMRGASVLRHFGTRYWFVVLSLLAFLWDPRWDQRFDEQPPDEFLQNLRIVLSEYVCVIGFLTFGENLFDARIFTEDKAGWLGDWALVLFLAHWFVHVAVPQPANWFVLVATGPLVFLLKRRRRTQLRE